MKWKSEKNISEIVRELAFDTTNYIKADKWKRKFAWFPKRIHHFPYDVREKTVTVVWLETYHVRKAWFYGFEVTEHSL